MARGKGILPHGSVSVANVSDMATREALQKLSENILAVTKVLSEMKRKEMGK